MREPRRARRLRVGVGLVAGCAMVGALLIALGNLFADVLRAFVDPRVREAA